MLITALVQEIEEKIELKVEQFTLIYFDMEKKE